MPEHLSPKVISWASILEPKTRAQALTTATMPFIYPHLALMPDAHLGKGATVGSVIPTDGAIIPAAVGVDIGCGMNAVRTQWTTADLEARRICYGGSLANLREDIEAAVPSSAGRYNQFVMRAHTRKRIEALELMAGAKGATQAAGNWHLQLGSLGGGNHFIEISADEEDRIWAFLHSGSRGVGNRLANHHIGVAVAQCKRRHIALPDRDLAYLVEGEPEFDEYIRDLRWAQGFALLNRQEMMDRVLTCLSEYMGEGVECKESIACHHNYTERERHFGKDVWVSRKGAIDASEGQPGLIPGSMGTRSYVVAGKGNALSLNSSPHGAGREYSRSAARKTFTRAELDAAMEGIEWGRRDAYLDEIPAAYKDIDVVMNDAKDLVEIKHELRQLVNVKGE